MSAVIALMPFYVLLTDLTDFLGSPPSSSLFSSGESTSLVLWVSSIFPDSQEF